MDRLIGLAMLRWITELRMLLRTRTRLVGAMLFLVLLAVLSAAATVAVLAGVPLLAAAEPQALIPALSALATGIALFWALSPLLAGLALVETHDVSRLAHYPLRPRTLLASSLLANLFQPTTLALLPPMAALAVVSAGGLPRAPLAAAGLLLWFALALAAAQVVGLVIHAVARNRRLHDRLTLVGLVLGFVAGFLPLLLLHLRGAGLGRLLRQVLAWDPFVLSPFAWGVRAAVHGGRGEALPYFVLMTWAALALAGSIALGAWLLQRILDGEAALGSSRHESAPARMPFGGPIGTLFEKELRVAWRDPTLKVTLVSGFLWPLILALLLTQGGAPIRPGFAVLGMASLFGVSALGANAFGSERRGIVVLLGAPTSRWRLLLGKNLAKLALQAPTLLALIGAGLLLAPPAWVAAAVVVMTCTALMAVGMDNFLSVRLPVKAPGPGKNPYGETRAGIGALGGSMLLSLVLLGTAALAAPFTLLAWLPLLVGRPWLWWATLPLALAGAVATYGMLVAGAARSLHRREPDLVERILVEA